jgi:hypothetical protein
MARRLGLTLVLLTLAAALAQAASAKEIDSVTISGPGISDQISLAGGRESLEQDTPIARLVEASGFFPEVFDTAPDPTVPKPKGDLGPRYVAVYVFPNPETGEPARVEQEIYPYAKPYPVTHVRAGREVWDRGRTHGGWILARSDLKATLVAAGLPRTAPAVRSGGGSSMGIWAGGGAGAAALVLGLAFLLYRQRRPKAQ